MKNDAVVITFVSLPSSVKTFSVSVYGVSSAIMYFVSPVGVFGFTASLMVPSSAGVMVNTHVFCFPRKNRQISSISSDVLTRVLRSSWFSAVIATA